MACKSRPNITYQLTGFLAAKLDPPRPTLYREGFRRWFSRVRIMLEVGIAFVAVCLQGEPSWQFLPDGTHITIQGAIARYFWTWSCTTTPKLHSSFTSSINDRDYVFQWECLELGRSKRQRDGPRCEGRPRPSASLRYHPIGLRSISHPFVRFSLLT